MVVLVVVAAVTAILLACLLAVVGRFEAGETRPASGLLQATAAPSRLLAARRPRRRSRLQSGTATDPVEVERVVREQLYGNHPQRG